MTDAGAALYGRAWVNHPPPKSRPNQKDRTPPATSSRLAHIADALDPERKKQIAEQAKLEAAAVMAAWERRTGR